MNRRKLLLIAGVSLACLGLYLTVPEFAVNLNRTVSLLSQADIKGLRMYLYGFGIWAPLVSMGLMVLQALASPLPAFVITFANAWIFGWFWGAVYSWTGAMLGASLCYWLAQNLGRPVIEKMIGAKSLSMSDEFFTHYGSHTVMLARLIPVVPFDVISYAAGLTTMGFWRFFWATGLGQLPATIIYSFLGENISPSAKYFFWAMVAFLSLLIFSLAYKQRIKTRLASDANVE